jgi:hypothetical protein
VLVPAVEEWQASVLAGQIGVLSVVLLGFFVWEMAMLRGWGGALGEGEVGKGVKVI